MTRTWQVFLWILVAGMTAALPIASRAADDAKRELSPNLLRFHAPSLGSADAKVHIVEFLDPACEGCRAFHPVVKQVLAENAGRVKLWVRHVPFHRNADFAVRVLEASRKQGKYWEVLGRLFDTQPSWAVNHVVQPNLVMQQVGNLGLDLERLRRDMADPEIDRLMGLDLADAKALRVRQTPTFYVNGRPLEKHGFDELKELVRSEVTAQYR
jgi:protein-disulfide isomerase